MVSVKQWFFLVPRRKLGTGYDVKDASTMSADFLNQLYIYQRLSFCKYIPEGVFLEAHLLQATITIAISFFIPNPPSTVKKYHHESKEAP